MGHKELHRSADQKFIKLFMKTPPNFENEAGYSIIFLAVENSDFSKHAELP
jgi:hypothetical protein